ncbi:hypothetical protein R3P38DRAFT_2527255, partial [Favolaschia claudopus]
APTLSTFSIAAFDSCAGWTWTCLDRTFPPNLPRLGYGMQATLIDNSAACVLLTGGWPFDLSNANMVLFDLSSLTMRSVGVTSGKFPKTVAWHVLGTITDSMPSGVILTTWVPYAGGNGHLVPEIWLHVPAPIAQIRCADLRGRLWHLELGIVVPSRRGGRLALPQWPKLLISPSKSLQNWEISSDLETKRARKILFRRKGPKGLSGVEESPLLQPCWSSLAR